jgi:hypothetical protein
MSYATYSDLVNTTPPAPVEARAWQEWMVKTIEADNPQNETQLIADAEILLKKYYRIMMTLYSCAGQPLFCGDNSFVKNETVIEWIDENFTALSFTVGLTRVEITPFHHP